MRFMHIRILCLVFIMVFGFESTVPAGTLSSAPVQGADYFPLKVGNYWLYEGVTRWAPPGSSRVLQKKVTWKMEVTEIIQREFITAAVIKGHPQDLANGEKRNERGDYLIIAIGEDVFYFLEGLRVSEVLARLRDDKDILSDLVYDDELFFRAPAQSPDILARLQQGSAGVRTYQDQDAVASESLAQKKYRLTFRSLPDITSIDFVPGIGITRYSYHHQGLFAEADLHLVEYLAG